MAAIHVIFIDYVRKISLLCEHYWFHSQQQKVNLSKCSKALKTFAQFVLLLLLLSAVIVVVVTLLIVADFLFVVVTLWHFFH